jgi:uncharacterized protein YacL
MFAKILALFKKKQDKRLLADLSVFEDGRILNIVKLDFLDIKIAVPEFVIEELNRSSQSRNIVKRNRAKRGFDIVNKLKNVPDALQIIKKDFPELKDLTSKTIALANQLSLRILTADFKLARTALSSKVEVLSLDAISKSFKQIYLPGESIMVFLAKEGAQANQAVGYLDDGTMVIADDAKKFIGKRAELVLTSIIQSSSGRMFFGKISDTYLEQANELYYKKSAHQ